MHKKLINGSIYYYTAYRDKNGKHRTVYLGPDKEKALKKERESPGKNRWLKRKDNSSRNAALLLIFLLGLAYTSWQMTGFFTFSPERVEFDWNESWNISEALVRISIGTYTSDIAASDLLAGGKIAVDASQLQLNSSGRLYADLIVGNKLVDSRHVDVTEEIAADETTPDTGLLEEEVRSRIESEGVEVNAVEKEGGKYKVTVAIGFEKKGSVIAQVSNVSDIKTVQVVSLPDRVMRL